MARIEQYGHGGDLETAAQTFGIHEWLDYSANINPLGPPPALIQRLQAELGSMIHYPDPAHRRFRRALAEKLKISADHLLIGNGAAECMALAIQALQPSQVGVVYPCFSEYTELSGKYGARVKEIYGSAPDYKPALEALETLIKDTDLVFIGSPNNPTGVTYEREELHALARASEAAGTWLVVDEAFLDFVDPQEQHSLLTELDTYPHVIIIRSMTKMFAIPGLRLGYAVAQPEVINRMKRKQITWSVNQLALLAGEVCLKEDAYVERTRQLISQERHALQTTLVHEFGWEVTIGAANFLLIRLPEYMTAEWMQDHLGQCGIMIRNCAMYPGLTAQHFRIAVRGRQENERLLAAFRQQLAEGRKSK